MAGEFKQTLKFNVKQKRRQQAPGTRNRTNRPRPATWLYPKSLERKYHKQIKSEVAAPLRNIAETTVSLRAGDWLKEAQLFDTVDLITYDRQMRPYLVFDDEGELLEMTADLGTIISEVQQAFYEDTGVIREDAWTDEVQGLINELDNELVTLFGAIGTKPSDSKIWATLNSAADSVWDFNRKQWNKSTRLVAGFEFETPEAWYTSVKTAWMDENFRLIKNISTQYESQISEAIYRGVRTGATEAEIIREVRKIGRSFSEARSRLIAVDQIGKLNGQLTKKRNTEVGANIYQWETRKDERVRGRPGGKYPNASPSHWAMQGMWCKWDDDTVYADPAVDVERTDDKRQDVVKITWHSRTSSMPIAIPGEEIRCRCSGRTVWEPILQEVDEEISAEARPAT